MSNKWKDDILASDGKKENGRTEIVCMKEIILMMFLYARFDAKRIYLIEAII